MEHFPTLFLYSHLALRHLVNTKLRVSQTIEMVRSDAAVQKASKENIVKKVKKFGMALNTIIYYLLLRHQLSFTTGEGGG